MSSPTRQASILLADDDPFIISLYRDKLIRSGHRVDTVQNGEDAIKRIHEKPPDLLVLDLNMPRMDGTAVLKYIREQSTAPDLPVIVLSNACARDIIDKVNVLRPTRFLIKYDNKPKKVIDEILSVLSESEDQDVVASVPAEISDDQLSGSEETLPELMNRLESADDLERQREALLDLYRFFQEDLRNLKQSNPLSPAFQFGEAVEQLFEHLYACSDILPFSSLQTLNLALPMTEQWLKRLDEGPASPELILILSESPDIRRSLYETCNRPGLLPLAAAREDSALDIIGENAVPLAVWNTRRVSAARKALQGIRDTESGSGLRVIFLLPEKDTEAFSEKIIDNRAVALSDTSSGPEILSVIHAWRR